MLNASIAFILLPVLTTYLSPSEYGLIEILLTVSACVTAVTLYGGNTVLSKFYYRDGYENTILGLVLLQTTFWSFTVGLLLLVTTPDFVSSVLNVPSIIVIVGLFVGVSNAYSQIYLTICQLLKDAKKFALFVNSKTVAELVLALIFVVTLNQNWAGRAGSILAVSVLFGLIAVLSLVKRKPTFKVDSDAVNISLRDGFPLMLTQLVSWGLVMIDKLMINSFLGSAQTGLYAVAFRFGMVIMLIETAFSRAWLPFFYRKMNDNRLKSRLAIVYATYIYSVVLLAITFVFVLLSKYVYFWVIDDAYHSAAQYIPWVACAYFFSGIWKLFTGYLIHSNRTDVYTRIIVAITALNIILNLMLIPNFGVIGAVWAMFISFFSGFMVTVIFSTKTCSMPWRYAFTKVVVIMFSLKTLIK